VYRDPAAPGYTSGIERIPDFQKKAAAEGGWEEPWELTSWGDLIMEVVRAPKVRTVALPRYPKKQAPAQIPCRHEPRRVG